MKIDATTLRSATSARDAALTFLRREGVWKRAGEAYVLVAQRDDMLVACRSPFQRLPRPVTDERAVTGGAESFPYRLEVWSAGRKVLNVAWDAAGQVELLVYRPGDWAAKL